MRRYIGDGGGLGVAFFLVAFALGIDRWKNVYAVLAAVAFAVFPTWAGLMATVVIAPRGEDMMFPLNVATVTITLIGHLIFGFVLGLAFLKAPRGRERSGWPWPPLFESAPAKRVIRFWKKSPTRPRTQGEPRVVEGLLRRPAVRWVRIASMSSHLELAKPSGRELIPLSGQRVTLGKASSNVVSLEHDETVSRLHAVFENLGFAWSIRDMGSRNGTYLNGERISAERVLRSGDEVRVGKSRLIFWEVKDSGEAPGGEETVSAQPLELPPRLTRRELDVLVVLCRPLVSEDPFPEPVSVRQMAGELFVTEAAVKQHLQNLYDKFSIPTEGDRRVRLANEALRRGAVTIAQLRDGAT